MQGLRTVHNTLAQVLRHVPLLGTASGQPCKVHVEATFYRVGAEEAQAAHRGASVDQVWRDPVFSPLSLPMARKRSRGLTAVPASIGCSQPCQS